MTHTQTQGAEGAGTNPFGAPAYDPASEIATQVMNLPWTRHGITFAPGVDFDDDALGDRHGEVQAIADKVIREASALAAPRADSAERTAGKDLNDRLRAAGMFTIPEMMGETPLTRWQTHAAMTSLDAFEWWLEAQVRQYLTMKAEYEIGDKPKDDELYEWVLAHSGAFHVIRTNFRAAKAATPAPAATPGVPDSVRALRDACQEAWEHPHIFAARRRIYQDALVEWVEALISIRPVGQNAGQRSVGNEFDRRVQAALAAWKEAQDTATVDEHQEDTDFGAMMCALAAAEVIAAQPAGQAGDAGAGNRERHLQEQLREAVDFLEMDEEASKPGTDLYTWLKVTEQLLSEKLDVNDTRPAPQGRAAEIVTRWHGWMRDVSANMDEPEWPTATRLTMENDRDYLLSLLAAPDSTRTGAAETEDLFTAIDRMGQYAPTTAVNQLQRLAEAALAARPEAPSDAGWRPIDHAKHDGTVYLIGFYDGPEKTDEHWCAVEGWYEAGINDRCWYDVFNERIEPAYFRERIAPPSDPAPSGQAEG